VTEQGVLLELAGGGCRDTAPGEENRAAPIGKPRLKVVNRNQLLMRTVDVEKSIPEDHPARGIWAMVERLDMKSFETSIKAVEGHAGQSTLDRRVLTALWIYANSEGVSSARELSRMCEYEPGCQWITGMSSINYHTLADFRMEQREALDRAQLPLREFMFKQIDKSNNWEDVYMFAEAAGQKGDKAPKTLGEVSTLTLIPAFVLSELKTAFLLGFKIYLPFLIIDMVISAVLISMGMMMLPPVLISLPFKLLLFVLVDGWHLITGSLMGSFVT